MSSFSVTSSPTARGSLTLSKVLMPFLQISGSVLTNNAVKFVQFMTSKAMRRRQGDRLQPELSDASIPLNMHMGRLSQVMAIKEDAVGTSVFSVART
jgi:hypothetical protein